ncbi:MAG TPA: T9SS type A sorting domain-containing protein [Lacibacter sp.]|nr:T9SS type A sorting domain-containing protein [Lacibacter sp.]
MKQLLLSLFLFVALTSQNLTAQIITAQKKARFGVEADLRSNFYTGFIEVGSDDWFSMNNIVGPGVGEFIIDTTGAAGILAKYTSQPATRNYPFFRNMRYPQFHVLNGMLLIDGIFIRDHHGDDSTMFAAGGNKNGQSPGIWTTPVAQSVPDKNEILDMLMHVRRDGDGTETNDSLWLFGGVSIENTTGDRYFDYEMYQTDIYYDKPNLNFKGYGPDAGHTSWKFDAAGNILTPGDIILTAEYQSSTLTALEARIWVHKDALLLIPTAFNWSGSFDGDGMGATYGYAGITPKTAGAFYTVLTSGNNTWAGPFKLVLGSQAVVDNYSSKQFMEFSVNLSKLGLDPLVRSGDVCGLPFRRILVKSRSSNSFTASLKDFVGPFSFFRAPAAEIETDFPILCQNGVAEVFVTNPLSTSVYNWSTVGGNIVGPTTGDRITASMAGTYIVSQTLMDSCGTAYATDTITITQYGHCDVLAGKPYNFNARLQGKTGMVSWNSDSEEGVAYFQVERSANGIDYASVGERSRPNSSGAYLQKDDLVNFRSTEVYYRLKYYGTGGRVYYSDAIRLFIRRNNGFELVVSPNPATNLFRINFIADKSQAAEISVTNTVGSVVYRTVQQVNTGINEWTITEASKWSPGQYTIQCKIGDEIFRKRIVVTH